jgi:hypothetical protein
MSAADKWFGVILAILFGGVLFALFGIPLLRSIGEKVSTFYMPSGDGIRIVPEYSVAEARAAWADTKRRLTSTAR